MMDKTKLFNSSSNSKGISWLSSWEIKLDFIRLVRSFSLLMSLLKWYSTSKEDDMSIDSSSSKSPPHDDDADDIQGEDDEDVDNDEDAESE